MMKFRMHPGVMRRAGWFGLAVLGLAGMLAAPGPSQAQSAASAAAQGYPNKPVRFVVPGAAGGGTDRVARIVGDRLGQAWGIPVVVENRAGGSGFIASEHIAKSPADGYSILFGFTALIQAPALFASVPYDWEKDFAPVSLVAYAPVVLVVPASSPIKTLAEYVAAAKGSNPVSYGSFGIGTSFHIYGETFQRVAGINLLHVPYKGESLSLTGILGGQLQSNFNSVGISTPHIRSGKLRALATVTPQRSKILPEVPTFAELGYPKMDAVGWFGALAPAATPRAIVDKLSADINRTLAQGDAATVMRDLGFDPVGTTPQRFAEFLKGDALKWKQMIQEAGIKASE
jgi:tripartite-type tricarboxylate transporter receptor subunit TctC